MNAVGIAKTSSVVAAKQRADIRKSESVAATLNSKTDYKLYTIHFKLFPPLQGGLSIFILFFYVFVDYFPIYRQFFL